MRLPIHVTVFTLGYLIYLFSDRTKPLRSLAVRLGDPKESWKRTSADAGREWLVYLQKTLGFILLGLLPFLLLALAESGSLVYSGGEAADGKSPGTAAEAGTAAEVGTAPGAGTAAEAGTEAATETNAAEAILDSFPAGAARAAKLSGLTLPGGSGALLWTILPVALVLAITLVRSGKGIPLDFYPQVRRAKWPIRRIILNALFWTLYLIGYEYAFRGYLLFPLVPELGLQGAVALNASLYALAHIYKGPSEAFGAFFLGIVFCLLALTTGSFVIPLLMHIIMAVGNDMKAVKLSHEMRFMGGGRH